MVTVSEVEDNELCKEFRLKVKKRLLRQNKELKSLSKDLLQQELIQLFRIEVDRYSSVANYLNKMIK